MAAPTPAGGTQDPRRWINPRLREVGGAACAASVLWFGEALIGLTPLFGHVLVETFSKHVVQQAVCSPLPGGAHSLGVALSNCHPLPDTPFAEICILAVVTSGLSLLPLFHFGSHGRKAPRTIFTYVLSLITLAALVCGAILYAIHAAGISNNAENATYYNLAGALFGSFALTLEKGILESQMTHARQNGAGGGVGTSTQNGLPAQMDSTGT